MARPLRLRQPLLKYPEDEYVLETRTKKSRERKSNTIDDATENPSQPSKAIVAGSKSRLVKGNLHTGRRTVQSILSPVLQDRTNLPHEPLKVDLLVKKGTDDAGAVKKSAKFTRNKANSATLDGNEDEIMKNTNSTTGLRKKSHKVENGKLSPPETHDSSKDVTENKKPVDSDAAPSYVTAGRRIGKPAMPKKVSAKKVVESEDNSPFQDIPKNDKAEVTEAETGSNSIGTRVGKRGGSKKVLSKKSDKVEKNSSLQDIAENDEAAESKAETRSNAIGTRINKRGGSRKILSKKSDVDEKNSSLQGIAENDETADSKVATRSNAIGTRINKRGGSRKILSKKSDVDEKNSSLQGIAENDETADSKAATRSNTIGTRFNKRGGSRKILSKKSDVDEKNSSLQGIAKNDETAVSATETPSNTIGTRVSKRGMLKKTSLPKKSADNVENEKKSYPKPSRIKVIDKNATTIKKFFKSKATADGESINSPIKKTVIAKRRNIGVRQKARMSTSFRLRQATLSESFAKQNAKKLLRPRQSARNYCEDSVISDKPACTDNKENVDIDKATRKPGPIYKTAELHDDSDNDKNEIYEFHFDSNDSREKISKKTRKRTVRKNILKRKVKAIGSALKKTTSSEMRVTKKTMQATEKINDKSDVVDPISTELNEPTSPREMEFEAPPSDAMETNETPIIAKNDLVVPAVDTQVPKNIGTPSAKPIVVQSVELRGNERISLTLTPQLGKSAETNARAKNSIRSSLQYRTMMNHALLTKTLSPINRAIDSFDPGSPWRPPTFANQQFSRVKNVVQSTPQVRKFAAMLEKTALQSESRSNKITMRNEIIANVPPVLDRISPKKAIGLAKSPRKFGTEISNVNKNPPIGIKVIDEINNDNSRENRISSEKCALPSTSKDAISNGQEREGNSFEDEIDDKENCTPSPKKSPLKYLSPKKSPLKTLHKVPLSSPKKLVSNVKPPRVLSAISSLPKENIEPQAGPSNVQESPLNDSRILRQTNLDNFLNLDEMPQSTRITTMHGIFDDAHSTPICGKPIRKINQEANVENAFGFDESDESSMDISPIKKSHAICEKPKNLALTKEPTVQKVKAKYAGPARFSIGDIKKHLLPIAKKSKVNEAPIVERIEKEKNEDNKEQRGILKNRIIPEPADTFADTFDVLENQSESSCKKVEEIPLFEDIELAHFKQAPRYSYKRKRAVGFILSENEEENESPVSENRVTKKRKVNKVERERQKLMENWANDLNNTFEEIDHFDLVVE